MAYSPEALVQKLGKLVDSVDSITVLSQWLLFHRKHAANSVSTWKSQLYSTPNAHKKLTLLHLANDVIQNAKRKGYKDFLTAFYPELKAAVVHTYKHASRSMHPKILRLVDVWIQRQIYEVGYLNDIKSALSTVSATSDEAAKTGPTPTRSSSAPSPGDGHGSTALQSEEYTNITHSLHALHKLTALAHTLAARLTAIPFTDLATAPSSAEKKRVLNLITDYNQVLQSDMTERAKLIAELDKMKAGQEVHLNATRMILEDCNSKIKMLDDATSSSMDAFVNHDPVATSSLPTLLESSALTSSSSAPATHPAPHFPSSGNPPMPPSHHAPPDPRLSAYSSGLNSQTNNAPSQPISNTTDGSKLIMNSSADTLPNVPIFDVANAIAELEKMNG